MQRVIAGLLNKQIADELGAAEKTIKIHRGRVMEKMQIASVAELVQVGGRVAVEWVLQQGCHPCCRAAS